MRPPRPPATNAVTDSAAASEAARQLERLNQAIQALGTIGQQIRPEQMGGQFQEFARGLMAMRTTMQATAGQFLLQGRVMERQIAINRQVGESFRQVQRGRQAADSFRLQTPRQQRFLQSVDRAAERRDRTPVRSEQEVGRNMTRRAREASQVFQIETLQTRTQASELKGTIAREARGEDAEGNPLGGGNRPRGRSNQRDVARAARDLERQRLAQRVQAQYEVALQDTVAARGLNNPSATTGMGAHQRELLHSTYEAQGARNRRAFEEAHLAIDLESGGGGRRFHGTNDVEQLRRRQREAYGGDVATRKVEELRDTQRLLTYEQERQRVLSSPAGVQMLTQELAVKARLARATAEGSQAEGERRRALSLGGPGVVAGVPAGHLAELRRAQAESLRARAALGQGQGTEKLQQRVAAGGQELAHLSSGEGRAGLRQQVGLRREDDLLAAGKALVAEQERRRVLASPEGLQVLEHELELKARLAQVTAEIAREEAARRRALSLGGAAEVPGVAPAHLGSLRAAQAGQMQAEAGQQHGERLEKLQSSVALERERQRYLASPTGRQALREEVRLRQNLTREQRASRFAEISGTRGRVPAYLDALGGGAERVGRELQAMAQIGSAAFATLSAGAVGLSALADPFMSFPTFTESLRALGIELGAAVLPVLNTFSGYLQKAAHWVRALDDNTKLWIVRAGIWVATGGLVVGTIYKIIMAIKALSAAGMMNPWIAGLTAALAVVVALVAEFGLLGDKASKMGGWVGGGIAHVTGLKKAENAIGPEDFRRVPEPFRRRLSEAAGKGDQAQIGVILHELQVQTEKELEAAKKRSLPGLAGAESRDVKLNRVIEAVLPDIKKRLPEAQEEARQRQLKRGRGTTLSEEAEVQVQSDVIMEFSRTIKAELKRQGLGTFDDDVFKRFIQALNNWPDWRKLEAGKVSGRQNADLRRLEAQQKLVEDLKRKSGTDEMDWARRGPAQAQILSAEQFADKLTLAALKGDDLTARNLERQLDILDKIEQNTRPGGQGAPEPGPPQPLPVPRQR